MLTLDEFAVRQAFWRAKTLGGALYWREVKGGGNGYILVWPSGEHHHTYKHPIDYSGFEEWPWEDDEG